MSRSAAQRDPLTTEPSKPGCPADRFWPILSDFTDPSHLVGAQSGLYCLYDADDRPVYIGQSQNLTARLRQHRASPPAPWTSARVLCTPHLDDSERLQCEALLIVQHLPRGNRAIMLGLSDGRLWEIKFPSRRRRKK